MKKTLLIMVATTTLALAGNCVDEEDVTQWAGSLGQRDKDAKMHIKWEEDAKAYDDSHPLKEKRRIFVFFYFDTDQKANGTWPQRWAGDAMIFYVKRSRTDAEIDEILTGYGGRKRQIYKGK